MLKLIREVLYIPIAMQVHVLNLCDTQLQSELLILEFFGILLSPKEVLETTCIIQIFFSRFVVSGLLGLNTHPLFD